MVTREGTSLDLLLFRRYGTEGQRLLIETLDLNPGLAKSGPILSVGTEITLPGPPDPEPVQRSEIIDLFGSQI